MDAVGDTYSASRNGLRSRVKAFCDHPKLEYFTNTLIILSAITLGLQTYHEQLLRFEHEQGWPVLYWLNVFDWVVIAVFTLEVVLRIFAQGRSFGENRWNLFDAAIVVLSLGAQHPFLAACRVLRVLRLLAHLRSLRLISSVIWQSLSGCMSIAILLAMVIFVFSIVGHQLYGATHPQLFGNLHLAMHSLFRVVVFYAYDDVVSQLEAAHPWVYLFIIPYFLIVSYVVINFFSAIVIYYLYEVSHEELKTGQIQEAESTPAETPNAMPTSEAMNELIAEVRALRLEIESLRQQK